MFFNAVHIGDTTPSGKLLLGERIQVQVTLLDEHVRVKALVVALRVHNQDRQVASFTL